MYERESNSGHIISWSPDNEDLAAQAVVDVEGTGINSEEEAKEVYARIDDDTAERIRSRYQELLPDNKSDK